MSPLIAKMKAKISALFLWTVLQLVAHAKDPFSARRLYDESGKIDLTDLIILAIAIFVISYLVPLGITAAMNATTTNWDPTVRTLWTVFWPLMAVLFVVIYMLKQIES